VLVLVHGWAAGADTWRHSGVVAQLQNAGWTDAGTLHAGPVGVVHYPPFGRRGEHSLYTAQLPAQAPLPRQSDLLTAQLTLLSQRHPGERLILAGHSAGALVARLVAVTRRPPGLDTLVSIAAPNLGTPRAIQGLQLVDERPFFCPGPGFDLFKQLLGGDGYRYLRDSRAALQDMTPHALTLWLNVQPHPDIRYLAIIHQLPGQDGDDLVPAASQDLNRVPALAGRARSLVLPASHGLSPLDGRMLGRLLDNVTTE
jgi:pimeloyl-ACP methyl ester carboxylesterase